MHVRPLTLSDPLLPAPFEGTRLLYVSDIDAGGFFSGRDSARAVLDIAAAGADILVLGGDYSRSAQDQPGEARSFFADLSGSSFPLGKYAVTGEHDANDPSLKEHMAYAGFRCLDDSAYRVEKGGSSIVLAGFGSFGEYPLNPDGIYAGLSKDDFVVCAAHDPAAIPAVMAGSSSTPGVSCALILTGHTHMGQIRLFSRTLLPMGSARPEGLEVLSGTAVVYSSGLGCEKLPFRLGTRPEAVLVTLTRG